MISKKLHAEIEKKWSKAGPGVYQRWGRVETRMPLFLKYIDNFKGKKVVEFGCNAGIYGYEIAQVADSYLGVDQGDYYIKQARITQKYIENKKVDFIARHVKGFIRDQQKTIEKGGEPVEFNAFFSTFALYHFSNKEILLIEDYVLPKCDVVIIKTRTKKRTPMRKYNRWKFWNPKNVDKFLTEAGFKCEIEWHPTKKFAIIIARREDVVNKRKSDGDKKGADKAATGRRAPGLEQDRLSQGSKMLPVEREIDAEGTDSLLPQVQEGVGAEDLFQSGQREKLPNKPQGSNERVEKPVKNGEPDTEIDKDSEGAARS